MKYFSYLALGDSYTVGEAVTANDSFPYQLATRLSSDSMAIKPLDRVAQTGWTTDELLSAISKRTDLKGRYDVVTLLIGVNNQYRGYDTAVYRKEFKKLLQLSVKFAGGKEDHVFVVSIPDWGLTPYARDSGRSPEQIAHDIDNYNHIALEETNQTAARFINITAVSRMAKEQPQLIASDGLHPSGLMYREWVDLIAPVVRTVLQ